MPLIPYLDPFTETLSRLSQWWIFWCLPALTRWDKVCDKEDVCHVCHGCDKGVTKVCHTFVLLHPVSNIRSLEDALQSVDR